MHYWLGLLLTANLSPASAAEEFVAAIHHSAWEVQTSSVECRLAHDIPGFGEAAFKSDSKGTTLLRLAAREFTAQPTTIAIGRAIPSWRHEEAQTTAGDETLAFTRWPMAFSAQATDRALTTLKEGDMVSFDLAISGPRERRVYARLNPIGVQSAYREFSRCLENLIPLSEIEHSLLHFETGEFVLTDKLQEKLSTLVTFLRNPNQRYRIEIRGHTDNVAGRRYNQRLSEKRAQSVADYLMQQGVPKTAIGIKAFGETKPTGNNRSSSGRASNRRVEITLRLID